MPTTVVEQSFWSRNRWLLPLLLALLIAIIVLGAIFGPRLVKSATGSTATPTPTTQTAVVTATPGGTPAAAGGSTPLPSATPVPTVPGLTLGEIITAAHIVTQAQNQASAGTGPMAYHVDPRKVVQTDLPHYGFTQPFQIVSPAQATPTPTPYTGVDGRPIINFIVQYQGKRYKVSLAQPATRGPKGVWFIVTIVPA